MDLALHNLCHKTKRHQTKYTSHIYIYIYIYIYIPRLEFCKKPTLYINLNVL